MRVLVKRWRRSGNDRHRHFRRLFAIHASPFGV